LFVVGCKGFVEGHGFSRAVRNRISTRL